jgi:hypothetical protein
MIVNRMMRIAVVQLAVGLFLCPASPPVHAVILYWSKDRATFEPHSCIYADSGWQYQGWWSSYIGTPIAPNYFITAKHVGGTVGEPFTYNGQVYTTTASYAAPDSDLRIWQVSTAFSTYAPLYTRPNEVGRTMVTFGRGTTRGSAVTVDGQTKGWFWGPSDGAQSWGSNVVAGTLNGGAGVGDLLYFTFDASGDYYESCLSVGDSGGGIFIKDGTTWKLAGVNYGADQWYSYTGGSDPGFRAAIFDKGGLWTGSPGNWSYVQDKTTDIPARSYGTRIYSNLTWIYSVIGTSMAPTPEPASLAVLLLGLGSLFGRRHP